MSPERARLLNVNKLPAFIDREEAADLLGRETHEMKIFEDAGFLKPCGHPPPHGKIMYSSAAVEKLVAKIGEQPKFADRVADAPYAHWKNKNGRKKKKGNAFDTDASEAA